MKASIAFVRNISDLKSNNWTTGGGDDNDDPKETMAKSVNRNYANEQTGICN